MEKWFDDSTRTIACVNQHFLNLAYRNNEFKSNLNKFDLVFPDGIGVRIGLKILGKRTINNDRTNYPDLLNEVFIKANPERDSFYFFGGSKETITNAVKNIQNSYPNVIISGFHEGYNFNPRQLLEEINSLSPRFLIVGLGGVIQEKWIIENSSNLTIEKICAVGGALRVFAKDRARGPLFLQKIGLEWFIRLVTEPKALWRRYLIGIPVFIFRMLKERFSG